jgi:hypothetical protein
MILEVQLAVVRKLQELYPDSHTAVFRINTKLL